MNTARQKGAGGQNHGLGVKIQAHLGFHALDPIAFHNQIRDGLLK